MSFENGMFAHETTDMSADRSLSVMCESLFVRSR